MVKRIGFSAMAHSMDIHSNDMSRRSNATKVGETATNLIKSMYEALLELRDEQFLSSTTGDPRFDEKIGELRLKWLDHDLILEPLSPAWIDPEPEGGLPRPYRRRPVVKILVRSESELFFEIIVLNGSEVLLPFLPEGEEIMRVRTGYARQVVEYLFNWCNRYLRSVYQPAFFTESSGRIERVHASTRLSIIDGTE